MEPEGRRHRKNVILYAAIFIIVNVLAILMIIRAENRTIDNSLANYLQSTKRHFNEIMEDYKRSFCIFTQMLTREIEKEPDPEDIWKFLKSIDPVMPEIEGETYLGLYMYYNNCFLYSWDTPYSEYAAAGYDAVKCSWYLDAVSAGGDIVFTPPYMSHAKNQILTTISQLQPDGKTVFAYDFLMTDIQKLVYETTKYTGEQLMIFDGNETVIGSTDEAFLGGDLSGSSQNTSEDFYNFRHAFSSGLEELKAAPGKVLSVIADGSRYYGYLLPDTEYNFIIFVPALSIYKNTLHIWLIPLLITELLLIYGLDRGNKWMKNKELHSAYIELGQTQRRLELALTAAQKAADTDELTGIMNFRSFRKIMADTLESMPEEDSGILIMIDGDHFKQVNDNYGHNAGDDVIRLTAQMIIGRIRTIDLASRLHGDEFAIFISHTSDYSVAKGIMEDINNSISDEAEKRNLPPITLSSGAVIARHKDTYTSISKAADAALYKAKQTHSGSFYYENESVT